MSKEVVVLQPLRCKYLSKLNKFFNSELPNGTGTDTVVYCMTITRLVDTFTPLPHNFWSSNSPTSHSPMKS